MTTYAGGVRHQRAILAEQVEHARRERDKLAVLDELAQVRQADLLLHKIYSRDEKEVPSAPLPPLIWMIQDENTNPISSPAKHKDILALVKSINKPP
jgi:hypothetical protein